MQRCVAGFQTLRRKLCIFLAPSPSKRKKKKALTSPVMSAVINTVEWANRCENIETGDACRHCEIGRRFETNLTCEMPTFCLCCSRHQVRTPGGPRERPPDPDEPRLGSGHCCHLHMRRGLRAIRVSRCQHSRKKYSHLFHEVYGIWTQKRALTLFQLSSLFWGVTQPRLVVCYRRFGSAYWSSDCFTFGDGTYRLCRNVGSHPLTYAVKHPMFRIQVVQGS
jgi:hypothetical protein